MLRCSGDLELGPEWLRFLWLSAAAEQLGVEFDRSGLHGWLAIRRLRRREAEMCERREAEAERKAVAERERRDAEDRERRKEAERAEQWRRAEEKRRIATQQDEMREREACKQKLVFWGPTDALKLRPGLFRGRISLRWAPLVRNTPPEPPGGHF